MNLSHNIPFSTAKVSLFSDKPHEKEEKITSNQFFLKISVNALK